MRWTVRDAEPPYDPLGYVMAPPPEDLAKTGFKHLFRLSRWANDHRDHFEAATASRIVLAIGLYRMHGEACQCGACPAADACFMSMGHPPEVLRRIVGYHPVTVLRAAPASLLGGSLTTSREIP